MWPVEEVSRGGSQCSTTCTKQDYGSTTLGLSVGEIEGESVGDSEGRGVGESVGD